MLFSHPKDFTPVCTTELGAFAKRKSEFDQRNVKLIGVSVDPLDSHHGWAKDIDGDAGRGAQLPAHRRPDRKVADLYDMIHPNANDTMTVRSVFIIGPDKKVKLIITYPASTGRNVDELLRVIDSLQLTAGYQVATPVNWTRRRRRDHHGRGVGRGREGQVPEGLGRGEAVPAHHAPAEQVATATVLEADPTVVGHVARTTAGASRGPYDAGRAGTRRGPARAPRA